MRLYSSSSDSGYHVYHVYELERFRNHTPYGREVSIVRSSGVSKGDKDDWERGVGESFARTAASLSCVRRSRLG